MDAFLIFKVIALVLGAGFLYAVGFMWYVCWRLLEREPKRRIIMTWLTLGLIPGLLPALYSLGKLLGR